MKKWEFGSLYLVKNFGNYADRLYSLYTDLPGSQYLSHSSSFWALEFCSEDITTQNQWVNMISEVYILMSPVLKSEKPLKTCYFNIKLNIYYVHVFNLILSSRCSIVVPVPTGLRGRRVYWAFRLCLKTSAPWGQCQVTQACLQLIKS